MSRYRLDSGAQTDLDEIYDYVAQESLSAADRLIDSIQERFVLLAAHPLMGQARPELAPNVRSFAVGNYVVFYRPRKDGIEVARVIHSARDVECQF